MQVLARVSVLRPIFATVLILALAALGLFSLPGLGVERYPNVDVPTVQITTLVPGASPEEIESEVTDVIERQVGSVPGIETLTSTSSEGQSLITLSFVLEKNGDVAEQEVRGKIDLALADLPKEAERPVVAKFRTSDVPVVSFTLSSEGRAPLRDLTEYTRRELRPRIEGIRGVGDIQITGGRERQINILIDPNRLRAFDLTVSDITRAVQAQNLLVPGGSLNQGRRRYALQVQGRADSVASLGAVVVQTAGGRSVRLRDVAAVEDGEKEAETLVRVNGKAAVLLNVRKQAGENTVAVVNAVRERMTAISRTLPHGYKLELVRDDAVFVNAAVHDVQLHLLLGSALAAVVVLIFLKDFRSTVIAAISIPASIVATFALMKFQGFSLNVLTLLALTLAVGIVIDDAIIVLENIVRYLSEKDIRPKEAAIEATREIGLAVLATTLSLVAVFLPVALIPGIVGRFLASFGVTMTFAILVSLLVAFTTTPSLASLWLKPGEGTKEAHGAHGAHKRDWLTPVEDGYERVMHWSLRHRWLVVIVCALTFASVVPLGGMAKTAFTPPEDQSIFAVNVRAPEGTTLAETERILSRMAADIRPLPEVLVTAVTAGEQNTPNRGSVLVKMREIKERKTRTDQFALMARVRNEIVPRYGRDLTVTVAPSDPFGSGDAAQQFVITGPDREKILGAANKIVAALRTMPEVASASTNAYEGSLQIRARIDRDRAADLGVAVADVAATLRTLAEGEEVGEYGEGGRQYDIRIRALPRFREGVDALSKFTVPAGTIITPGSVTGQTGAAGGGAAPVAPVAPVPLSDVVSFVPGSGPSEVNRYNRRREVRILVNPVPGASQAPIQQKIDEVYAAQGLPADSYQTYVEGDAKETAKTFSGFAIAFGLSFVFMYLILAAQFESWIHPVTILLSLPLCVPFALLPIVLTGDSINLFSLLGILVLFGIVKKNSILQVDHANGLRAKGLEREAAVVRASRDRLRPILMTTIAFVAGMIPLALSREAGAATNRSIATVVIGGQTLSLALTLIATPVFYTLFDDAANRNKKWREHIGRAIARWRGKSAAYLLILVGATLVSAYGRAGAQTAPADGDANEKVVVRTVEEAVALALARNQDTRIAGERVVRARQATEQYRSFLRPQFSVGYNYTRLSNPNVFNTGGATGISLAQIPATTGATLPPTLTPLPPVSIGSSTLGSGSSNGTQGGATRSRQTVDPDAGGGTGTGNRARLDSSTLQAGASLLLDVTGAGRTGVQIGKLDEEIARFDRERVRQETAYNVRTAAYGVQRADAILAAQNDAVRRAEEQLRVTEERQKAGVVAPFEVLRARNALREVRQGGISARTQGDVSRRGLAALLGGEAGITLELPPPSDEPLAAPDFDADALIRVAILSRPEAIVARLGEDRSGKGVRFARRTQEPSVSLGVSGTYNVTPPGGVSGLFGVPREAAVATVTINFPLYDGGATRAAVAAARSEAKEAALRREQFEATITADVRQSVSAVRDAFERFGIAEAGVAEAREALDIARLRFKSGVGLALDVLDAQATLTRAEVNAISARFDYREARARLARATGADTQKTP